MDLIHREIPLYTTAPPKLKVKDYVGIYLRRLSSQAKYLLWKANILMMLCLCPRSSLTARYILWIYQSVPQHSRSLGCLICQCWLLMGATQATWWLYQVRQPPCSTLRAPRRIKTSSGNQKKCMSLPSTWSNPVRGKICRYHHSYTDKTCSPRLMWQQTQSLWA